MVNHLYNLINILHRQYIEEINNKIKIFKIYHNHKLDHHLFFNKICYYNNNLIKYKIIIIQNKLYYI